MMNQNDIKVDVVIPVYNAKDATKKCLESIYKFAGHKINAVYIHDDNSEQETAEMLDSLKYDNLHIWHSEINNGFGYGVNHGVTSSTTNYVLVLNSDTVAEDDFITPLIETLESDSQIAALNVCGEVFGRKELEKFDRTEGYVRSYSLSGYAFLIRRKAFDDVSGFDLIYGRGYFEDADIARRLINKGWKLGMQPDTYLRHEHQGSFKTVKGVNELFEANKIRYYERHVDACKNIIIFSTNTEWTDLPQEMLKKLNNTLSNGSKVYWVSKMTKHKLPCLDVRFFNKGIKRIIRLMNMKKRDKYKGVDEVWFAPDTGAFRRLLYTWIAKRKKISVTQIN